LSESIIGVIPVLARLAMGSERLKLYVTRSGLIVAHGGKRGAGAMAGMSVFGKLSGAIEDFVKGGKETIERRDKDLSSPKAILSADKDNFLLPTDDIVKVELDPSRVPIRLVLVTRSEKFQLSTAMSAESLESLLRQVLKEKVSLEKRLQ
jgi:hypothetical protein